MNNEFIYSVRSLDEIEALKTEWLKDPSWDIEKTLGFEGWHDELLAYRQQIQENQNWLEIQRVGYKTATLGINARLLTYIEALEGRIDRLEKRLNALNSEVESRGFYDE